MSSNRPSPPATAPGAPTASAAWLPPLALPHPAVPARRIRIVVLPPRALARRSVRWGVARIAMFFAASLALLVGADLAINFGLRRIETSDFGVTNRVFSGRAGADIVITGSSRALSHYDPRILQEITGRTAFNLGRDGSQTDMQVAFLRAYLRHNAAPGLLIHNLDLFSFVTSREIFDPGQYLPYLHDDALYGAIQRIYPHAWKWKHLPLYGYVVDDLRFTWIRGAAGLIGLQPREDRIEGFRPQLRAWTGEFEQFVRDHPDGVTFAIEPQGVADLAAIIQTGREYGIPVLFVYSPEYHGIQSLEKNRAEVFAQFRALAEPAGVVIWDFSDSALSRSRDHFYNSQHLNAAGASAFSRDLATQLAASPFLPPAATSTTPSPRRQIRVKSNAEDRPRIF